MFVPGMRIFSTRSKSSFRRKLLPLEYLRDRSYGSNAPETSCVLNESKPAEKQTKQQPVKNVPTKQKGKKQPKFQNNTAL